MSDAVFVISTTEKCLYSDLSMSAWRLADILTVTSLIILQNFKWNDYEHKSNIINNNKETIQKTISWVNPFAFCILSKGCFFFFF